MGLALPVMRNVCLYITECNHVEWEAYVPTLNSASYGTTTLPDRQVHQHSCTEKGKLASLEVYTVLIAFISSSKEVIVRVNKLLEKRKKN